MELSSLPEMVSAQEVADLMDVHPASVTRWCARGELSGNVEGRKYCFPRAVIHPFVALLEPGQTLLRVKVLATLFSVDRKTVERWREARYITGITLPGGRFRYLESEARGYLGDAYGKKLLTSSQVAGILRVSNSTVGNWARDGRVNSLQLPGVAGEYRFLEDEVEKYL